MDEGVDPTRMCQSLVDKVARSKQLTAVADPDVLVLFEDWLDELENEARALLNASPSRDPLAAARELGLSESGAAFLAAKLTK